jgi:hypothetical protein
LEILYEIKPPIFGTFADCLQKDATNKINLQTDFNQVTKE